MGESVLPSDATSERRSAATRRELWWNFRAGLLAPGLDSRRSGLGPRLLSVGFAQFVDAGVPKGPGDEGDQDPIEGAERAIEELEAELLAEFMEKATRGIPPDATVREAIQEMKRAAFEDPEVRELGERMAVIRHFGGGAFLAKNLRDDVAALVEEDADVDVKYRLRQDLPHLSEEIELMKRITDVVHERLPPNITADERHVVAEKIIREDAELMAILERLEELRETHGMSLFADLAALAEEEEEEDDLDPS
jgi:hypothetical protein